jgi:hypothetical protein
MLPVDIRKKLDAVALDLGADSDEIPAWDAVLVAGNDEASRKGDVYTTIVATGP